MASKSAGKKRRGPLGMAGEGRLGASGAVDAGIVLDAPESLDDCQDDSDRLAYLCAKYDGTYTRQAPAEGKVRVTLTKSDGDAVAGNGATTAEAITELLTKLGEG